MPMFDPAHPGALLKSEIVEANGLSVTETARLLGVSRPTLSSLLNEKAELSPEMALRFEKAFGVDMDMLMRVQTAFNIAKTRRTSKEIHVERYEPKTAA